MCYLLWVWALRCHLRRPLRCCCCESEDSAEGQEMLAESLDIRNTVRLFQVFTVSNLIKEMNNTFQISRLWVKCCFNTTSCILIMLKKMQCKDKCLITERSPEVITYSITENWIYELLTTGEVCVSREGCFWRYWGHCLHICLHVCLHTLETSLKSLLQLPLCFQVLGCTLETNTQIELSAVRRWSTT